MQKSWVQSSVLQSVGYDAGTKILELEFREGGTWNYFNVPPQAFKKFINSASLGHFFVKKIKGKYRELRVQ